MQPMGMDASHIDWEEVWLQHALAKKEAYGERAVRRCGASGSTDLRGSPTLLLTASGGSLPNGPWGREAAFCSQEPKGANMGPRHNRRAPEPDPALWPLGTPHQWGCLRDGGDRLNLKGCHLRS